MSNIWIYAMFVRMTGWQADCPIVSDWFVWPDVLCGKHFSVGQYMQTFLPNFLIPAMPVDTFDLHHF